MVYRRLDGSDHVFHPLNVVHEIAQVDAIVRDDGHWLFPRAMFRELIHMEVVHVLLTTLLVDWFSSRKWCIRVLTVRHGSSGNF